MYWKRSYLVIMPWISPLSRLTTNSCLKWSYLYIIWTLMMVSLRMTVKGLSIM